MNFLDIIELDFVEYGWPVEFVRMLPHTLCVTVATDIRHTYRSLGDVYGEIVLNVYLHEKTKKINISVSYDFRPVSACKELSRSAFINTVYDIDPCDPDFFDEVWEILIFSVAQIRSGRALTEGGRMPTLCGKKYWGHPGSPRDQATGGFF